MCASGAINSRNEEYIAAVKASAAPASLIQNHRSTFAGNLTGTCYLHVARVFQGLRSLLCTYRPSEHLVRMFHFKVFC